MTELEKLQVQLEQLSQKIEEQAEQDALAGYGWGCSDKTWTLHRQKYALIKQIQDLTNQQTCAIIILRGKNNETN